jgi:hypothetical protein
MCFYARGGRALESLEVSEVRIDGYPPLEKRRAAGLAGANLRALAVPLPELPGSILPLGSAARRA